ncbi:MAG: type II secretion system protein GspF [Armatimonadia bacterium]|nr:type II secretion system protein GspF [Armatimonadia bacterium]
MPTFRYSALDAAGSRSSGTVVVDDEQAAVRQLRSQGLFPIQVKAEGGGLSLDSRAEGEVPINLFRRVKQADLTIFSRQLADLVRAGLPLLRSIHALSEHTENPVFVEVLQKVAEDLSGGTSLADALAAHPRVFPNLYISMVRAGEASGQLPEILERLAQLQETERSRRSQIMSALTYPIMLVCVGTLAVSLLVTFLVPRFKQIFEDLGRTLPGPTQFLMDTSEFVGQWWWAIILAIVGSLFAYKLWSRTGGGKLTIDKIKLRIPRVGRLVERMVVARFARTFGTLLHGGVDVLQAFSVVRNVVGNEVIARALDEARDKVREGDTIHGPLRDTGHFPPVVVHMVALGEETGNMEGVLSSIADSFEEEVENRVRALMSMLEPLIIISLGAVVFFIVSAMLLPIFQLNVGSAG